MEGRQTAALRVFASRVDFWRAPIFDFVNNIGASMPFAAIQNGVSFAVSAL